MIFKKQLLALILAVSFFGFLSCSGDDSGDDEVAGVCGTYDAQWDDVMNALTTYSTNPSEENCENYKSALREFYDDFQDCDFWGGQYEEAIESIDEIDCSES